MTAPTAEKERSPFRNHTPIASVEASRELSKPAQEITDYRRHSLAAKYWGQIPNSVQPLRQVTADEAQAAFIRGLLERPTEDQQSNRADWLVSVLVHVVVVGIILVVPLVFTQAIDLRNLQITYLAVPKPPAAAPTPPPPVSAQTLRRVTQFHSTMVAPALIPRKVAMIKDEPAPDISGGVVGGVEGGEVGGVLGGILGGTEHVAPPPPPAASKKTIYRVGGAVKPPREIKRVEPVYSPIARAAHVEGIVFIDAVIDEHGDVVEARAVSGPGLLIPAALQAVTQWKYEPTYLDGVAVEIRMQVQVAFQLR